MNRALVRSGRHPFQIVLLATCLVAGMAGLILPPAARTMSVELVFGDLAPLLYLALALASALSLLGAFWRGRDVRGLQVGLQLERAGMPVLAGAAAGYSGAVLASAGARGLIAAVLIGGIAVAALVRTRQITRDLVDVRDVVAHRSPGR